MATQFLAKPLMFLVLFITFTFAQEASDTKIEYKPFSLSDLSDATYESKPDGLALTGEPVERPLTEEDIVFLNELEKGLNEIGHSLRDEQQVVSLDDTTDQDALEAQATAFTSPQKGLGLMNPEDSKVFTWEFASKEKIGVDKIKVHFDNAISMRNQPNRGYFLLDSELKGYLWGRNFQIFHGKVEANSDNSSFVSLNAHLKVLGKDQFPPVQEYVELPKVKIEDRLDLSSKINVPEKSNSWGDKFSWEGFRVTSPRFSIPIVGAISIGVEVGAAGEVGLEYSAGYTFSLRETSLNATITPYAKLEGFANVSIDAVVAEAGVRIAITIVDVRIPLKGEAGINFTSKGAKFYREISGKMTVSALGGYVQPYIATKAVKAGGVTIISSKETRKTIFRFKGISNSYDLFAPIVFSQDIPFEELADTFDIKAVIPKVVLDPITGMTNVMLDKPLQKGIRYNKYMEKNEKMLLTPGFKVGADASFFASAKR
ncbi:hypothetical protein [Candidatus Uabimicrobium amorphum]|uniref:Uncharacterized protein n=1 Tax=Uabimicrobium amorphum TaxID=2596890 RepID=A0A5S9IRB4_UABAM|nr:hypothetical protein [Candidatus Uabimicrobium amorphum]BBM86140.1 hypothetical protein UABAM_04526 [Candidatus Uabimicrobium amorphum]